MGEMIVELCMSTGWSFRDVMQMPMPTFALFVGKARKKEEQRFNRLLFELCDVVMVSRQPESFHEGLKSYYFDRFSSEKKREKRHNPRTFDMENKEQATMAAQIVAATLKKKAQLMGLSSGR